MLDKNDGIIQSGTDENGVLIRHDLILFWLIHENLPPDPTADLCRQS
jgi:hypothetical protein